MKSSWIRHIRNFRTGIFLALGVLLTPLPALPREPAADGPPIRISIHQIVSHLSLDAMQKGFMNRLGEKGLRIQYHVHVPGSDMEACKKAARTIARENPDLVLAISTPSAQACKEQMNGWPLVFTGVTDPVGAGLVISLEKPGKGITGMTDMSPVDRQLELMLEVQPSLKKLGVLYCPLESNSLSLVKILKTECQRLEIEFLAETADNAEGVIPAAQRLLSRCDAVYTPTDNTVVSRIQALVELMGKNRMPLYSADIDSVPKGTILALGIDYYKMGYQTGRMAEEILQGRPPGLLPVESLEDVRIHVNIRAARAMGVDLPVQLLEAADAVYDTFPYHVRDESEKKPAK